MWIWKTKIWPGFVMANQFVVSWTNFASIWKPYMEGQHTTRKTTIGSKGGSIENGIGQNAGKLGGWAGFRQRQNWAKVGVSISYQLGSRLPRLPRKTKGKPLRYAESVLFLDTQNPNHT
jgi:hypothetical protein